MGTAMGTAAGGWATVGAIGPRLSWPLIQPGELGDAIGWRARLFWIDAIQAIVLSGYFWPDEPAVCENYLAFVWVRPVEQVWQSCGGLYVGSPFEPEIVRFAAQFHRHAGREIFFCLVELRDCLA